jgi:adenylate cyclase
MFCDLRGFTRFAEELDAEQVIDVLNRYLTGMSDAILDHGGTLVSYMGDGIMAIFGAPIERADHADAAFAAAREMLEVRLAAFNSWLREHGLSDGFRMGIGLNSGPVMSGNVGSERRLEYAAIGDTTNVASRLEALSKKEHVQLLVADSTRGLMTAHQDELVSLGALEVAGRSAGISAWTLASEAAARETGNGAGPDAVVAQPA